MSIWPLFSLEVQTPLLTLRPLAEADALYLADVFPSDIELNPQSYRFPHDADHDARRRISLGDYWRAYGTWSVEAWALPLGVHVNGSLVGVQTLEGDQFPLRRVVDSASWLIPSARGQGLGKDMRRAMLALAFGPMRAEEAISAAWLHNSASLGVSSAMGYQPNGLERHVYNNAVGYLQRVRLTAVDWRRNGLDRDVTIHGFADCAMLFGLDAAGNALAV